MTVVASDGRNQSDNGQAGLLYQRGIRANTVMHGLRVLV